MDAREPPAPGAEGRRGPALLLVGVVLAPWAFRLALLWERGVGPGGVDLRGFASDLAVALLALGVLLPLRRASRAAATLAVGLWVVAHYANLEVVRALDALADLRDAGYLASGTFVRGSAGAISRPALLVVVALASAGLVLLARPGPPWRKSLAAALAGALLLGAQLLLPASGALRWRQVDFLAQGARGWAGAIPPAGSSDPAAAMRAIAPDLAMDVSGAPRIALPHPGRNVLVVVLESVSGIHLESLSAAHGRTPDAAMPRLDALARRNLSFATFVAHQRKTNRGLYALLCGELPNLLAGVPKMTSYPATGGRTCLPRILSDAGYRTAYLQAAPLAFMLKDPFMGRAGFGQVLGHDWFRKAYARNAWGVDDRAFFERARALVRELGEGSEPWFLTLFTVGTHHPFVLPEDFQPDVGARHRRALAYLDMAFARFVEFLEAEGILEDTLVLITSDESLGAFVPDDAAVQTLTQNWGFLVALAPERPREQVQEPFAQMDLALSVLDYLGLASEHGAHLFGRSVFRRYASPRHLFFANTNLGAAGAFAPDGRLLLCLDDFRHCEGHAPEGGLLFGQGHASAAWDEADGGGIVRALAEASLRSRATGRRDLALLHDAEVAVAGSHFQVVHGGQHIDLTPDEWLEVELEVEATAADGVVELRHILKHRDPPGLFDGSFRLGEGQTLHTRYRYAPPKAMTGIECQSLVRVEDGGRADLVFRRARLTVRSDGPRPEQEVEVLEMEVAP